MRGRGTCARIVICSGAEGSVARGSRARLRAAGTSSTTLKAVGRLAGRDGSYGTSMPAHKAMDPASDVILAYKHNGRLLTPDHVCPSALWSISACFAIS
jgi:DMSO/TMAO reductase YedYZ molybdopterin-dependent catalytic subunit